MQDAEVYTSFYYERVPFSRVWKWNINGRNQLGDIMHLPRGLTGCVKNEHAADMLVYAYTQLLTGLTKNEVNAMIKAEAEDGN